MLNDNFGNPILCSNAISSLNDISSTNIAIDDTFRENSFTDEQNTITTLNKLRIKNINRLIIGQININGLQNKFDSLKYLIYGKLDILIIIESKLEHSFPTEQFFIEGFAKPYRLDRNIHGGGIMVYIREDIASKEQKLHANISDIEGIFIEINLRKKRWLLFAGYNNLKSKISSFLDNLGKCLDKYISKYENLLVIGDFNSEIKEIRMSEFCDIYDLQNLIKDPTCYKTLTNPSCIDVMLTNKSKSFQNSQTLETGLSDFHKMTITILKSIVPKQAPKIIKYRD